MDSTRRYIFNGSAAAYGGRFVRPDDVVLSSNGGSALSQAGGRSVWSDTNIRLGKAFRVSFAFTSAEGLYDNREHAIEVTYGKRKAETLNAVTIVRAELRDMSVGGAPPLKANDPREPEFRVRRLAGALTSRSQPPGRETSVHLNEAVYDGVSIDGHELIVDVNEELFRAHDTHGKLAKALSGAAFVKEHGAHFGRTRPLVRKAGAQGRATSGGHFIGTIVKGLRWEGAPYRGAEIDGPNTLKIPNFGRVHFGEIIIKQHSRRLSMIRFALGSPTGGDAVAGDVDTNGGWSI
jgi:hypothetical protein